jgi:hypothetical protein
MGPGDAYVLALVVTALLVAPFNAMARIVVMSWIVAHIGFLFGTPEIWANLFGQSCVLALGWRHLRCSASIAVWLMSFGMVAVNFAWLGGRLHPEAAWWAILIIALSQLLILPFAVERNTQQAVVRAWHETTGRGMFRTRAIQ